MKTKVPVGTKVYTFRDNPFTILEGTVVEHLSKHKQIFNYRCQWYDPILDWTYTECSFDVYLTAEAATKAHSRICKILFDHAQ